jgi:acetyl-CoA carboxylase/biotin carboxylase 1
MTEISAGAQEGANGRSVPYVNGKASYAEKFHIADHFIGGNRLENAPPSKVKDFVGQNDGHTVITNVRTYLSRQNWSFGEVEFDQFRLPRQF